MVGNDARSINQLCRLATPHDDDSTLLKRFLADTDASAFAELVRRHGPMVLGVCRRVLGNGSDADDAFQATFIALARKADSVRNGQSVGSWLFGAARFAALQLRDQERRRRRHELNAGCSVPSEQDPELLAAVDEELARLPARYRAPVVACFLQDRTQEDAARELGCSLSTLRRRLERGLELLRRRLTGRAAVPVLGALGGVGVGSPVPAALVTETTALIVALLRGETKPAPAVHLAEGVIVMMSQSNLKRVLVAALVVTALVGSGVAWQLSAQPVPAGGGGQPASAKTPEKPAAAPEKTAPPRTEAAKPIDDTIKPGDRLLVRVLNAIPADPPDSVVEVEASGKIMLGPSYGRVKIDGLTLEDAEKAIIKHLQKEIRHPLVSVVRYNPPPASELELRVRLLEKEVKELRSAIEDLRAKKQ